MWSDPQINVLVGDGKPGVTHLVNASPPKFRVYGVVDRDFDDGNAGQLDILAKQIARKMRELSSIPPVFVELRQVLRNKAGVT